jgi:murein DD-endopeptidase MepM/ murein hydrolase activator NlpD
VLLLLPLTAGAAPAVVDDARAATAPPPRFAWPLPPEPVVTRPFRAPAFPYGPGHRGVDLAAPPGGRVRAAGPGVVVFAGHLAGRGVVSIDHDGGLRTTYEPLAPTVLAGEQVYAGQPIGTVTAGHAGCRAGACLHWGVRRGREYLDPLRLVRVHTVLTLKPWAGTDTGTQDWRPVQAVACSISFARSRSTALVCS